MPIYYDKEKLEIAENIASKYEGVYVRRSDLTIVDIDGNHVLINSIEQAKEIYQKLKGLAAAGKLLVDQNGNAVHASEVLALLQDSQFICRGTMKFSPRVFER